MSDREPTPLRAARESRRRRQDGAGAGRRVPHARPSRRAATPLHQALGAIHLGQRPHRPRAQLLDRRRLRALPARARGDVLFAFGFDAFGLPAELGAIAGGMPPSEWVARCARAHDRAARRLGFSFDWERTFMSSDAVMYRWSQWLFLTLLEAGLIYHGTRHRRLVRHVPDDARDRSRSSPAARAGAATTPCGSCSCRSGTCASARTWRRTTPPASASERHWDEISLASQQTCSAASTASSSTCQRAGRGRARPSSRPTPTPSAAPASC